MGLLSCANCNIFLSRRFIYSTIAYKCIECVEPRLRELTLTLRTNSECDIWHGNKFEKAKSSVKKIDGKWKWCRDSTLKWKNSLPKLRHFDLWIHVNALVTQNAVTSCQKSRSCGRGSEDLAANSCRASFFFPRRDFSFFLLISLNYFFRSLSINHTCALQVTLNKFQFLFNITRCSEAACNSAIETRRFSFETLSCWGSQVPEQPTRV